MANRTVAAHFAYISRKGKLTIETDEGYRVAGRDAQKALLNDWHLELSAGQYRAPRDGHVTTRRVKLVHNIMNQTLERRLSNRIGRKRGDAFASTPRSRIGYRMGAGPCRLVDEAAREGIGFGVVTEEFAHPRPHSWNSMTSIAFLISPHVIQGDLP